MNGSSKLEAVGVKFSSAEIAINDSNLHLAGAADWIEAEFRTGASVARSEEVTF